MALLSEMEQNGSALFDSFSAFIPCWRLQRVKKVIGIELCQEAVEDAKVNAALNGEQAPGFG